jgi:hypothetical protein
MIKCFEYLKKEMLADPEIRAASEAMSLEFALAREVIAARNPHPANIPSRLLIGC